MKVLVRREYHGQIWFETEEVNAPPGRQQRSAYRPTIVAGCIVQTDTVSVQDDEQSHFAHESSVSIAEDFSHP